MELKYPSREALHLLILGLVCGVVFFANLGRIPFYDKGEPREALVVRDIVLNGNWIFPLKAGQQIPSKPPLFHWAAALSSMAWGEMTEATVRFPSAFFASLGIFLVYYLGRKLFHPVTGLFAGLILATSIVYQDAGVEARVDMTLTFWLTLSLALFYGIASGFLKNRLWRYAFFFTVGLGVLAKGPVSLVLCALIVAIFLAARKRWGLFRELALHPGVILAAGVFSLWYGSALWLGGETFFALQFIKENLARFFVHGAGGTGHQKAVYYFIPYLFTLGLPWTLLLPVGLFHYFRSRKFGDERELFLGIWIAVIFVFFSLSAGKRPPYILPLYPPLALLMAVWIQNWQAETDDPGDMRKGIRMVAWCAALIGAVILLLPVGSLFGQDLFWLFAPIEARLKPGDLQQFQLIRDVINARGWLIPLFLLLSALLWFLIGRSLFRHRSTAFVAQLAGVSALSFVVVQGLLMPAVASEQSYKGFVESVQRTYSGSGTMYLFPKGLDYTTIVFYGGKNLRLLPEDDDMLMQKLAGTGDYVIIGERECQEVLARSSLSIAPLLRSQGTGPDRDNPLILIRGTKSELANDGLEQ
jgi:4-amino-4-deoxy-L-arabinose transferase-like glycosyltransferase